MIGGQTRVLRQGGFELSSCFGMLCQTLSTLVAVTIAAGLGLRLVLSGDVRGAGSRGLRLLLGGAIEVDVEPAQTYELL